jgi:hypothetical protein
MERREAERLRRRRVDHLPHVDPHAIEEDLQLVHERDVDAAVGVLEDLRGLGDARRADGDDALDDRAVERARDARTRGRRPADELRDRARREATVRRILPLGREREEDVAPHREPARLEERADDLVRRPGVGGALEHHELPGPERARRRLGALTT